MKDHPDASTVNLIDAANGWKNAIAMNQLPNHSICWPGS
jgi:hypothetical protein